MPIPHPPGIKSRLRFSTSIWAAPRRKSPATGTAPRSCAPPALAARIIEAAVRAVSIPVSVKFRLGWDADSINAVEFAKMAESSGAAFVTVHGRTRMQMYSGTADWDKIAEVVNAVRIPVIGNGDVFSGTDAAALAARTGCAGIMAARGAQGNPFLFAEIRAALRREDYVPPSARARLDAALRHISEYVAAHGDGAFADMRKHIAWYTKGHVRQHRAAPPRKQLRQHRGAFGACPPIPR